MSITLGISAFYHDSAAAVVSDGYAIAAAQEERFTRVRHDSTFPKESIKYCLDEAGIALSDLDAVAYYENPRLKFGRVVSTSLAAAPHAYDTFARTIPEWLTSKRKMDQGIAARLRGLGDIPARSIAIYPHHLSHAASAFLPSPYESAAILCVDGVGEWATTTLWHGKGTDIKPLVELQFPHSLGLLYSAFTYFCGFKVDSGEYKVMGLAPYGTPRYADLIRQELVDIREDGSFRLDVSKFAYIRGKVMTGPAFESLFGGPRRTPEGELTQREFDLAASVQKVTEDIVGRLGRTAQVLTGEANLCMAGGVALNCVANGKLSEQGIFKEIWVQPASGDAGGALGAALLADLSHGGKERPHLAGSSSSDGMSGALLGPEFSDTEIRNALDKAGAVYTRLEPKDVDSKVAQDIADGKIVGWFQGRMEFGPRALGARSILGDPRDPATQKNMNLRIKFRESFRPFAPSVLEGLAHQYFDLHQSSPYMLMVAPVAASQRIDTPVGTSSATGIELLNIPRSTVPAVTHVDYSARVQTVSPQRHDRYFRLIDAFHKLTGCPMLVNTSFNVRGEPIVHTPQEAYACFMRTDIDVLAIGSFYLLKHEQPQWDLSDNWRETIPLD